MTRLQFLLILVKNNCTLDFESEECNLNVDAHRGLIFNANGCHCICEPFCNNGGQSWKPQAYQDAADRVLMGTRVCDIPDCDICQEDGELFL